MDSKEPPKSTLVEQSESNYVGLQNIGATCYMNSVLQTLFMTPEFRENIYQWKFNSEESSIEECIPLQLQILFGKMQLKSFPYIDTRDLAKSFGWNYQEGWEQHDTQEFIKILFDAIEKSLAGSKNENFINDIFEGTVANYVKCQECNFESITQENFLDLVVTVKNLFDRIYNDSLEKGIQRYIKPEILEKDNQYFCTRCNKKVDAQRGSRFYKLPKILSFVMNRFTFDFMSMKRIKLDDFISFPFVLNMNDYINGYDGIKNKLSEEVDPNCFITDFIVKPPSNIKQRPAVHTAKTSTQTSVQNRKIKPVPKVASNQTRQFLQSMRQKKPADSASGQSGIFISFEKSAADKMEEEQMEAAIQESLNAENAAPKIDSENKIESSVPTTSMEIEEENKNKGEDKQTAPLPLAEVTESKEGKENKQNSADQNNIYEGVKTDNVRVNTHQSTCGETKTKEQRDQSQKRREASQNRKNEEERQNYKNILKEHLNKHVSNCSQLIEKYLLEGPLVYELYSILIHSGGAYGGHYYAYIKEDSGKWHSFNDTSILEIDVSEISSRVFGGNNTNAYLLFYRQWEPAGRKKSKIDDSVIPAEVIDIIHNQKKQWEEEQIFKLEQSKMMSVKVHYILNVKVIQVKSTDTLNKVLDAVIKEFKIQDKRENVRLRRYKPQTDQKLEAFEDEEHLSLHKLKISHFSSLCVEIKKDGSNFEEYSAGMTHIKMAIWKADISSLEEQSLETVKVSTRRGVSMYRLMEQMARAADIPFEKIVVVRRLENIHGISTASVLSLSTYFDLTIEELGIEEGNLLFTEEKSDTLKWGELFESDQNKIIIKFNTPNSKSILSTNLNSTLTSEIATSVETTTIFTTGGTTNVNMSNLSNISNVEYNNQIQIDNRETMEQLKQKLAEQLKLDIKEFIMRRGGRAGIELKEMSKTIRSMNFTNHSSLFLELGRPAKEGEIRVLFYLAKLNEDPTSFTIYQFQEIGELPIQGTSKASEVKQKACEFVKEVTGIDLDSKMIRLREKVQDSLTRVYREKKMREQQVIEKRMIAIEIVSKAEDSTLMKDYLVSFRVWNQQTWTLSKVYELFITKTDSGLDFANKIYSLNEDIKIENISAMKVNALWNFSKSHLLTSEWFKLQSSDVSMCSHPFHIINDGALFIIKDDSQIQRELTEEEMKEIGVITAKQSFKKNGLKKTVQQKEKSLSIKVKKKEIQKDTTKEDETVNENSQIQSGKVENQIEPAAVSINSFEVGEQVEEEEKNNQDQNV